MCRFKHWNWLFCCCCCCLLFSLLFSFFFGGGGGGGGFFFFFFQHVGCMFKITAAANVFISPAQPWVFWGSTDRSVQGPDFPGCGDSQPGRTMLSTKCCCISYRLVMFTSVLAAFCMVHQKWCVYVKMITLRLWIQFFLQQKVMKLFRSQGSFFLFLFFFSFFSFVFTSICWFQYAMVYCGHRMMLFNCLQKSLHCPPWWYLICGCVTYNITSINVRLKMAWGTFFSSFF